MSSSYAEKSVWVQFFGLIAILGSYFLVAGMMISGGVTSLITFVPLFIVSTIALVIILAGGQIIMAIVGRSEAPDERYRLISWRAHSNSSWVLAAATSGGITGLVFSFEPVWIAHLLLLSMFLSELAKLAFQIFYYRTGV
ncbi:MAG: hypothetical protein OEV30_05010 [Ignavibacteria bacterium]|nr:hypothetical protein [Ignavibacteria bacterium]